MRWAASVRGISDQYEVETEFVAVADSGHLGRSWTRAVPRSVGVGTPWLPHCRHSGEVSRCSHFFGYLCGSMKGDIRSEDEFICGRHASTAWDAFGVVVDETVDISVGNGTSTRLPNRDDHYGR